MLDPALRQETGRLEREFPMQKIEASQFESLFEEHLQIYNSDQDALSAEQSEQDDLANRLREINASFVKARKGDSSETKAREKALQDLENGYLKYKEIVSNLDVGRKFYNDLATIVTRFRDGCKSFVHGRRLEASHLEAEITSASLSNLNLNSNPTSSALQAEKSAQQHQQQQQQDQNQYLFQQRARPPPPSAMSHQHEDQQPPLPAPQAQSTVPGAGRGMWQPEMGIKFAPALANQAQNPHAPAYPQASKTATGGNWTPGQGIRFS